jgi:hypothetical protein
MAPKVKKPRQNCLYTAEERRVIQPFKHEYQSQAEAERRGHIFKSKILPAIFDYWEKDGPGSMSSDEVATRVKVCT